MTITPTRALGTVFSANLGQTRQRRLLARRTCTCSTTPLMTTATVDLDPGVRVSAAASARPPRRSALFLGRSPDSVPAPVESRCRRWVGTVTSCAFRSFCGVENISVGLRMRRNAQSVCEKWAKVFWTEELVYLYIVGDKIQAFSRKNTLICV